MSESSEIPSKDNLLSRRHSLRWIAALITSSPSLFWPRKASAFFNTGALWQRSFTPNAFSFADISNASISTVQTSGPISLTGKGITGVKAVGTNCTISINGTNFYSSISGIKAGSQIWVQTTASPSYSTSVTASVKVGTTTSGTWTVTTSDPPAPALITPTGSTFGDMTGWSGLSAAFNGVVPKNQPQACARGAATGYAGKAFSAPQTIRQVVASSVSAWGYTNHNGWSVTLSVYGNSSSPTSGTDGTLLGTTGAFTDNTTSWYQTTIACSGGPYQFVWLYLNCPGTGTICVAEIDYYV